MGKKNNTLVNVSKYYNPRSPYYDEEYWEDYDNDKDVVEEENNENNDDNITATIPKYEVFITPFAYGVIKKINELSKDNEWRGNLVGTKDIEAKRIIIEDVLLPPQEVGGVSVELITEDDKMNYAKFMTQKIEKEGIRPEKLIGEIHSHGNLETFFSTTDDDDQDEMLKYIGDKKIVRVAVVVNNKMKMRATLQYNDESVKGKVDKMPVHFWTDELNGEKVKKLEKEFSENVKEYTYTPSTSSKTTSSMYGYYERTFPEIDEKEMNKTCKLIFFDWDNIGWYFNKNGEFVSEYNDKITIKGDKVIVWDNIGGKFQKREITDYDQFRKWEFPEYGC